MASTHGDDLDPCVVIQVTGPLPFSVLEQLCGLGALEAAERAHTIDTTEPTVTLGDAAMPFPLTTSKRTQLARLIADRLSAVDLDDISHDASLKIAALLQRADRYDFGPIRNGARAALVRGDAQAALAIVNFGLAHDPGNIELLHLQAMALESAGEHGAATALAVEDAAFTDPAWLGRWASNLFLSTGRTGNVAVLDPELDEHREMLANLAWIQALEGDVPTVARSVNHILDDPRSSAQAVVWACVAGAVPAALDGRARIATSMIRHCRSIMKEVPDQLSPFADLQVGLAEVLTILRCGRLLEARDRAEQGLANADGDFLIGVWSFFSAIVHREMGAFERARALFNRGFETVDSDPFGLMAWAESEARVSECMVAPEAGWVSRPDASDGYGLFRSCLHRNQAWVDAAMGNVDDARSRSSEAAGIAVSLGQNAHVALAALDIARFGDPRNGSALLLRLSEFDSPLLAAASAAIHALEAQDSESLVGAARIVRTTGMALQAGELVHRARVLAARNRQPVLQARLDLLDPIPVRPTPLLADMSTVVPSLTPREREIALRGAAGDSSRAISDALGISIRTVDNLLGRVYRKCDFGGRSDVRRWLDTHR